MKIILIFGFILGLFSSACSAKKKLAGSIDKGAAQAEAETSKEEELIAEDSSGEEELIAEDSSGEEELIVEESSEIGEESETFFEGMEVFTSCDRCFGRAQALAESVGFEASLDNLCNTGATSALDGNLCDVHFMASADMKTASGHNGKSIISNTEIAMFCPCSCYEDRSCSAGPGLTESR